MPMKRLFLLITCVVLLLVCLTIFSIPTIFVGSDGTAVGHNSIAGIQGTGHHSITGIQGTGHNFLAGIEGTGHKSLAGIQGTGHNHDLNIRHPGYWS